MPPIPVWGAPGTHITESKTPQCILLTHPRVKVPPRRPSTQLRTYTAGLVLLLVGGKSSERFFLTSVILTFAIVLERVERPERWPVDIFFPPRRPAWRSWSSFRRAPLISGPTPGWSHPGILNWNSRYPQHGAGHLPGGGALACWPGTQSGSWAPGAVLALGAVLGTSGAWTGWGPPVSGYPGRYLPITQAGDPADVGAAPGPGRTS